MNKCTVCKQKFDNRYFVVEQNKCILHSDKNNANNINYFHDAFINYIAKKLNKYYSKESLNQFLTEDHIKNKILDCLNNKETEVSDGLAEALEHKILLRNIKFPLSSLVDTKLHYVNILNKLSFIEFNNCYFEDELELDNNQKLIFRKCHFSGEWQHILCKEIKYIKCIFENFIIDNIAEDKLTVENHLLYNCSFKNIHCEGVIFKKRFFKFDNVNKYKKINDLKLINCEFQGDFILNITDNEDERELEYFEIKNLDLAHSTFERKVKIQFCNIEKEANFYNTKFKDLADFYRTKFNKVVFERTDFEKISVFSEVEFNKNVNFKYTKFLGKSIFRDTIIKQELDLRNSIFDDEASFLDITSQKRKLNYKGFPIGDAKDIKVANRETARIIKNFYDNSNNIIEANKFYALEMKKREKELKEATVDTGNIKVILDYFVFKIHGMTSNHSQDWILALLWMINITFMYSISYFASNYHNNVLSTVSFYSIIFLLFIHPKPNYLLKILLLITAFIFIVFSFVSLDVIAVSINPFSKIGKDITLYTLIYKTIMAYLLYQFVVSIRQNTRRK